jgi:hypothetical protein
MDSIGNNRGDISYTVGGLAWMVVGWVVALVYCMAYGWRFVYILKKHSPSVCQLVLRNSLVMQSVVNNLTLSFHVRKIYMIMLYFLAGSPHHISHGQWNNSIILSR